MANRCNVHGCGDEATMIDESTEFANYFCDQHGELAQNTGYAGFAKYEDGKWFIG